MPQGKSLKQRFSTGDDSAALGFPGLFKGHLAVPEDSQAPNGLVVLMCVEVVDS